MEFLCWLSSSKVESRIICEIPRCRPKPKLLKQPLGKIIWTSCLKLRIQWKPNFVELNLYVHFLWNVLCIPLLSKMAITAKHVICSYNIMVWNCWTICKQTMAEWSSCKPLCNTPSWQTLVLIRINVESQWCERYKLRGVSRFILKLLHVCFFIQHC